MVVTVERGASGIWWVEARDAAKHPTMDRTAATTKKDSAPSVRSATVENPAHPPYGLVLAGPLLWFHSFCFQPTGVG